MLFARWPHDGADAPAHRCLEEDVAAGRRWRKAACASVVELVGHILRAMIRRSRDRLGGYWWLWVSIVVGAVIFNEAFDRRVAGDKNGHPGGDVLVAIAAVLIVLAVWDLATRSSRRVQ
jgi:hypothetical protein